MIKTSNTNNTNQNSTNGFTATPSYSSPANSNTNTYSTPNGTTDSNDDETIGDAPDATKPQGVKTPTRELGETSSFITPQGLVIIISMILIALMPTPYVVHIVRRLKDDDSSE